MALHVRFVYQCCCWPTLLYTALPSTSFIPLVWPVLRLGLSTDQFICPRQGFFIYSLIQRIKNTFQVYTENKEFFISFCATNAKAKTVFGPPLFYHEALKNYCKNTNITTVLLKFLKVYHNIKCLVKYVYLKLS